MDSLLISCDWGTSSFRLRLVESASGKVLNEIVSKNGISETFKVWKEKGIHLMPRTAFFLQRLKEEVTELARLAGRSLDGIVIVLSGMASSSIGMLELPYAEIPFSLDGSDVKSAFIEAQPGFLNDIFVLSGVRSARDVMRGEETQLIGLNALMELPAGRQSVFIFPGTHSKHMYVEEGNLLDFKTFMTGEVFNIMANQSILKDSVDIQSGSLDEDESRAAFAEGIRESGSGFILNALFTVRTNQLFDLLNKKQNAMYLSGLLIGSELRYLVNEEDKQLVLCSGNNLFQQYKTGCEMLGLSDRTVIVAADLVDRAATAAHIRILEHHRHSILKFVQNPPFNGK